MGCCQWFLQVVSVSGTGLAWDPADYWVCGEGFADQLGPGDVVRPLVGAWEMDEEQEVEDRQDHLQTSAAGFGS